MALQRHAGTGDIFERVEINVFEIKTKEIIFTGDQRECADFLKTHPRRIKDALLKKYRLFKKYAIRYKSQKAE